MKSPQEDKRLLPLRGGGNQPKPYHLSDEDIKLIDDAKKEFEKIVYGFVYGGRMDG